MDSVGRHHVPGNGVSRENCLREQTSKSKGSRWQRTEGDSVWSRDWRLQVLAVNEAAAGAAGGPGGTLVSCYKVRFLVLKVW